MRGNCITITVTYADQKEESAVMFKEDIMLYYNMKMRQWYDMFCDDEDTLKQAFNISNKKTNQ